MKRIHHLTWLLMVILLLLPSCSEDNDCDEGLVEIVNSTTPLPAESYGDNLLDCRLPKVQRFEFPAFEGGVFRGEQNTQVIVPAQSIVDQNGEPIDVTVTLELIEMYSPGAIIACQLSTNGLSTTGIVEPLLSEGIYYINLVAPGQDITLLNPINVFTPSNNEELLLFQFNSLSCQELECKVLWEINPDAGVEPSIIDNPDGTLITGYQTSVFELGWVSLSRYNPTDTERTIVYNKAPTAFNGSNSDTFLLYNSESIAVALFDRYDTSLNVFSETYGQIPIDTPASYILVTHQQGMYQYAWQTSSIGRDQIGFTPEVLSATETSFITQVNSLQ
ncbi:MAG: hypothetical protein CL867_12420 [Cytophagaceae bacterium]|nr:hypothetical protein [Cytophagaceae bacterium]